MFILILGFSINNFAAITVSTPSSGETVAAAEDYASAAFQDPWDMNERTDLGWFIWDVTSGSRSNLSNIAFSNGIFSANSSSSDPNISILDTGVTGTCFLGKIGTNYKINADKYKIFAIRMKLSKAHDALFYWSRNTIYKDQSYSGIFSVYNEWRVYIVNLPNLGYTKVPGKANGYSWSGNIDSLRFDPAPVAVDINIDWIRLVEDNNSLYRTIQWSGNSGSVDIYLDTDKNEGNGTLGKVASNKSGSSYNLYVGALAPGAYYVGVKNTSGGAISYAPGYYNVNGIPTVEFTSPGKEGGEDYATAKLGNAWDMNAVSDLDYNVNVNGLAINSIAAEDQKGTSLGNVSVLKGTSVKASGVGDPVLYPLLWWGDGRGQANPIDANKYRILVLKMSLPGNWDLNLGSVARVIWKRVGEGDLENVSEDVIVRHKSGAKYVISTIIADMKTLPIEVGSGSPSRSGWSSTVEGFRIDPHEFAAATNFYIQSVKLAAYERANDSYTIQWNYKDGETADTRTSLAEGPDMPMVTSGLSLYTDTDKSGFNGTLIASGLDPAAGHYVWNTAGKPAGTYYIYAVVSDGLNTNQYYAQWPIVIDHSTASAPTISLSKTAIGFGDSGSDTFTVSNSGTGTLNWSVSDNASWLSVTPTSGQNSGTVTVTVSKTGLAAGTYKGTVSVSDTNASNSPQTVAITLTVGGGTGTGTIKLSRSALYYGAVGNAITGPQSFLVSNTGSGVMNWSVSDNATWLSVSPSSGSNTGTVSVTANKSGLSAGTYTGTVTVSSANATNSPRTLAVTLKVYNSGSEPFGEFATPVSGTTVKSSIAVTGWVLDDTEVASVKIYNGNDYVGDAVFVEGSRPDVATAYPGYPKNYRAGWGYMMLTYFLPNGGNGSYTFYAVATDKEGHQVSLGSTTINIDNAHAVKPFGAIDTPAQGGTASGSSFVNFGWVLTPQPNKIATNGSTINVMVDGVTLGHPTYNQYRSDIATLFPSYANSNGAVGYYYLNTKAFSNGVHTIQWVATDNAGNNDGIGSRYFTVQNTGSDMAQASAMELSSTLPGDYNGPLWIRTGYDETAELKQVYPDENGQIILEIEELDRLEIRFFDTPMLLAPLREKITPSMVRLSTAMALPAGSSLDAVQGVFYWQPGVGYLGEFPMEFNYAGPKEWVKKTLTVRILPKQY